MITIYSIAYNEEILLPYFIRFYRTRFPNCNIVIYDNCSTDSTKKIALSESCSVINFDTNNEINEYKYLEVKNHCWKQSLTDWVLVCDIDEWFDVKQNDLLLAKKNKVNIFRSQSWNMVNMTSEWIDPDEINYGVRDSHYDKCLLFNSKQILEINYDVGCHHSNPVSFDNIKYEDRHLMYHMGWYLDETYRRNKNLAYAKRLSKLNIERKWGHQYLKNETDMRAEFDGVRKKSSMIRHN